MSFEELASLHLAKQGACCIEGHSVVRSSVAQSETLRKSGCSSPLETLSPRPEIRQAIWDTLAQMSHTCFQLANELGQEYILSKHWS